MFLSSPQPGGEEVLLFVGSRVSDDMNRRLDFPISAEEVKATLSQMHPSKAPGPDGMHFSFFKNYGGFLGRTSPGPSLFFSNLGRCSNKELYSCLSDTESQFA